MPKLQQKRQVFLISIVFLSAFFLFLLPTSSEAASSESLSGIALKNKTVVYQSTSTSSKSLKGYSEGSILKYRAHNSNWYITGVYINGKKVTGYIHKNDVETIDEQQTVMSGISLSNQTKVYSLASKNSNALKSYTQGHILKYRKFSPNWYITGVIIKGKKVTGYIHKNDVENGVNSTKSLSGVAVNGNATIYSHATSNSKALKSYAVGSTLKYREFSNDWYVTGVYINGKKVTGYLHKSEVDTLVNEKNSYTGVALKSETSVYTSLSTNSESLKSYAIGSILKYSSHSESWYSTSVIINGKKVPGYIYKNDVENAFPTNKQTKHKGVALKSPTNVYSRASNQSKPLNTLNKGEIVEFNKFSPNWYKTSINTNGKVTTGYLHLNDVSIGNIIVTESHYKTDFKQVVDIQMKGNPQVSSPKGGWQNASRSQVEYYVNSSNFKQNSIDYYQFLLLSQPAFLNVNEVNNKILNNKGILSNQAAAFLTASKKFNINEAYLISHALLETGNGTSALAKGIPVDANGNIVDPKKAVHTVYNMYGIGAIDKCPKECGAKEAFNKKWFTPEAAIIGGAEFIDTYITRGQDTLYKMRWNPINPGYPQYATDVGWALKQTVYIYKIYQLLDNYSLFFDVPRYAGQPSKSGDPNSYLSIKSFSLFNLLDEKIDPISNEVDESNDNEQINDVETDKPDDNEQIGDIETDESDDNEQIGNDETDESDDNGQIGNDETDESDDNEQISNDETDESDDNGQIGNDETDESDDNGQIGNDETDESDDNEQIGNDETDESDDNEQIGNDETDESDDNGQIGNDETDGSDDHLDKLMAYALSNQLNLHVEPSKESEFVEIQVQDNEQLTITNFEKDWYEIHFNDSEGWVHQDELDFTNLITTSEKEISLYSEPVDNDTPIVTSSSELLLITVLDDLGEPIHTDGWYKIYFNDGFAWYKSPNEIEENK